MSRKLKVLVACEYSGRVRNAFSELGHDVLSADFEPADDNSPFHYQGDCFDLINDQAFDLMIAHPPCTYLSVSGMHWTTRGLRDPKLTEEALDFVRRLMEAPIPHIAIENPISVISTRLRKPDQIIQPWWFGDDASKQTCLWLKNLPPLEFQASSVVPPKGWSLVQAAADMVECECCGEPFCPECNNHYADCGCIGPTEEGVIYKEKCGIMFATRNNPEPKMIWGNQTESGQNKLPPSKDRWKERSRTYRGIANAMAEQWGGIAVTRDLFEVSA